MTFDAKWDDLHRAKAWGLAPKEELARFIATKFPDSDDFPRPERILDLGCGAGASAQFLNMQLGFHVTAIDGSQAAIDRVKDWVFDESLDARCLDVCDIGPDLGQFDAILDVACLQHLPEPGARAVVAKAYDLLKPGGWFFAVMVGRIGTDPSLLFPGTRRVEKKEIPGLLSPFTNVGIGWTQRYMLGRGIIHEWIVEAQKAATEGD